MQCLEVLIFFPHTIFVERHSASPIWSELGKMIQFHRADSGCSSPIPRGALVISFSSVITEPFYNINTSMEEHSDSYLMEGETTLILKI